MQTPNKHEWSRMFDGLDSCRICSQAIPNGTGKAEHARAHVREGKAERLGEGTKTNPYRYVPTRANGSNND